MPKVMMKTSLAGLNFSYVPGDIIEVREDVADAWVKEDMADLVDEEKPKKKAAVKGDD